ncbi:MAG: GntR family transcriptional regulator [Fibrella sp.]|nr:GntR family transcriptional regulator [Armatimonadota bacterium]
MPDDIIRDPIYFQASDRLRSAIRDGSFAPGQQFFTERQIGERFGISRATANKALAGLVSEGLLEFRKGVGTFVRAGVLDYDLRSLVSFKEKARAAGMIPATEVRAFHAVAVSDLREPVREALRLDTDETVTYIERLRLADGVPVILEFRYLRERYCPDLQRSDVGESLYNLLTDRYRLHVAGADEVIRAVSLTKDEAEVLQAEPGDAALQVIAVGFIGGGTPLWWERTLYRGDAYEFRNRLGPITNPSQIRPAVGTLRER